MARVLITGRGTSGSFQIRGVQLGAALGATVIPNAVQVDEFDQIILVKRATPELLQRLKGKPIIWDVVDAWPQPIGNSWTRAECMEWLKTTVYLLKPAGIIAATHAMMDDLKSFYSGPVLWLPHHYRPGLHKYPVRYDVLNVGYEGGVKYLGKWLPILQRECKAKGWNFVMNPPSITSLDLIVALRDAKGYAPRAYKSNVKLANAQGSGIPIICNRESGYLETAGPGVKWADTEEELCEALEEMVSYKERSKPLGNAMSVDQCAERLREWLSRF